VLLLDEPTAGMSPEETVAMQRLIAHLPAELTVVIIEHDMDVVFGLAERITVLDYGSVLLEGTPEQVRGSDVVRQRYLGTA
jgi:branched-chain amino acid transport system ATP-binding protein